MITPNRPNDRTASQHPDPRSAGPPTPRASGLPPAGTAFQQSAAVSQPPWEARYAAGYQSPMTQSAMGQRGAHAATPERGPNVDVIDQPDSVSIVADLPGCDPEDIQIQVHERSLTIYAERDEEFDQFGLVYQRERPTRVQRTVVVPGTANLDEAEAVYENGVLTISAPKTEDAPVGTIPIQERS